VPPILISRNPTGFAGSVAEPAFAVEAVVKAVKKLSRGRVQAPRQQAIPNERARFWENLARACAARYGEEI
jgi:hypothetical protein